MSNQELRKLFWQAMVKRKSYRINYGDDHIREVMSLPELVCESSFNAWLKRIAEFLSEDCYIPSVECVTLILRKRADGEFFFLLSVVPDSNEHYSSEVALSNAAMKQFYALMDCFSDIEFVEGSHFCDVVWRTSIPSFSLPLAG
ncbi:hypothetical protein [Endozoicomonas sp. ONNA1]|uniref:hypothetical protein n=1 Tax=Endozoicomonas sp. ONNA1 TaxID=2828740 RepID=UPI0021476531|nr:hypothetical protein [Endozoicomonas sp. ONNA1]